MTESVEIKVRPAHEGDLEGLIASNTGLFAEDAGLRDPLMNGDWPREHGTSWYRAHLENPERLVLVADADGAVVGHLLGAVAGPSSMLLATKAELVSMYVMPDWRGQRIGSRLFELFSAWAREKGATQMRVTAYSANEGAVRFYQRQGFAPFETTLAADL
jgi:GNAT superfamily N-acetyltransferase